MNSPLTPSPRNPRRPRRIAAAVGALGVTSALAFSGLVGGGVQETEAAWNDTEKVTAEVTAEWATDSWVRATANAFTNFGDYVPERDPADFTYFRVDDRPSANNVRKLVATRGNQYSSPENFGIRQLGRRPETALTFCSQANLSPYPLLPESFSGCNGGSTFTPNFSQARTKGFGRSGGFAHPDTNDSLGADDIVLVEAENIRTMAECSPNGDSKALAPSASSSWGGWDGTSNDPPEPYGAKSGIGIIFSNLIGPLSAPPNNRYSALEIPEPNTRTTRWLKPIRLISSTNYEPGEIYFRATITSRQVAKPGYALSDLYVTIDQYTTDDGNPYTGSFSMILSRSECGVITPSLNHAKLQNVFEPRDDPMPTYPDNPGNLDPVTTAAPLPLPDGSLAYPNDPDYPGNTEINGLTGQGIVARGLHESDATTSALPPTITVTSPTEHTTASETTTSAPPNPGEGNATDGSTTDESTVAGTSTSKSRRTTTSTSVSASSSTEVPTSNERTSATTETTPTNTRTTTTVTAVPTTSEPAPPTTTEPTTTQPEPVIPDEPETLTILTETEKVGTVDVDQETFDAVVEGDTAPEGANQGVAALEIWLAGGNPGSGWEMFASADPESDGWKWAAIDQETGAIYYIR